MRKLSVGHLLVLTTVAWLMVLWWLVARGTPAPHGNPYIVLAGAVTDASTPTQAQVSPGVAAVAFIIAVLWVLIVARNATRGDR